MDGMVGVPPEGLAVDCVQKRGGELAIPPSDSQQLHIVPSSTQHTGMDADLNDSSHQSNVAYKNFSSYRAKKRGKTNRKGLRTGIKH